MAVNGSSEHHSAARVSHRRASATRLLPGRNRATGTSSNPASPACASASGRRAPSPGWKKMQVLHAPSGRFYPRLVPYPQRLRWEALSRGAGFALPVPRRRPGAASPVSRHAADSFPAPLPPVTSPTPASTVNSSQQRPRPLASADLWLQASLSLRIFRLIWRINTSRTFEGRRRYRQYRFAADRCQHGNAASVYRAIQRRYVAPMEIKGLC